MKNSSVVIIFAVLLLAGLAVSAYTLTADQGSGQVVFKAALLFIIAVLIVLSWIVLNILSSADSAIKRYDNLERLLFDIRDNRRSFFKERRESGRLYGEITAKIINKDFIGSIEVLNAGHSGILLKSTKTIPLGSVIDLKMFLPLFPQPIDVKARVIRSAALKGEQAIPAFDIAMEYTFISNIDKEKLYETIEILLEKQGKA